MGKVLRIVGMVAISVVGLALAAPTGGLSLVAAFHVSALFATIAAAAFTITAGLALNAILPAPSAKTGATAPPQIPPTQAETVEFCTRTFKYVSKLPPATARGIAPVRPAWWQDQHWPWSRFIVIEFVGECMIPSVGSGGWLVFDRSAMIRPGDLFGLKTTDHGDYANLAGLDVSTDGLLKRFIGTCDERAEIVFECSNPRTRIRTPRRRIVHAYRCVKVATDRDQAFRAARALAVGSRTGRAPLQLKV